MFYLSYLRSELVRRKSRTILTLLGLAIGVALVIAISSLSRGLDHAQKTALNPLSSIGTDLTVTLSPQEPDASAGAFGGPGGGGFAGGGGGGARCSQANQSAITDLSKLGKPGTHFVHDFFLPGTQLTFPQSQAQQIAKLDGVAAVSSGLMLSAVHQEGTVPKIVAKIKTGGQRLTVTGRVGSSRRQAEQDEDPGLLPEAAVQQSGGTGAERAGERRSGAAPQAAAARRQRRRRRTARRRRRLRLQLAAPRRSACRPQFRNFRRTITTPQQTIQQLVDPPQTNIKSSSYTIGGVDPAQPGIGARHAVARLERPLPLPDRRQRGAARRRRTRAGRS